MFVEAIDRAVGFTRPIHFITRYYDSQEVYPGAATLFIVNADGWGSPAATSQPSWRRPINFWQSTMISRRSAWHCAATRTRSNYSRTLRFLRASFLGIQSNSIGW